MNSPAELQITHKCRWAGCTDWSCQLCRQNADRCFHDLHPSQTLRGTRGNDRNAIASSMLRSDCKQPFSVVIADPSVSGGTEATIEDRTPSHLQISLLDSADWQSLSGGPAPKGQDLEKLISSKILNLPHLLKAELPDLEMASYSDEHQLIIPFCPAKEHQTGPWVMSEPLHIYSEYALAAIRNRVGSQAKTVSLVIQGLRQNADGKLCTYEALQPFISSPFTFYTRRREDKGMIPKRSNMVEDLQGMAEATANKLRNLQGHLPEKKSMNPVELPANPIKTAGELFDFIEPLSNETLEEISNKILGRSKVFLAKLRENLRNRMITMENDTRPRLWHHRSNDLGLLFAARRGIVIGPEEAKPTAICLSTGKPVQLGPEELLTLARTAMKEYSDPRHGQSWSLATQPLLPTAVSQSIAGAKMLADSSQQSFLPGSADAKRVVSRAQATAGQQNRSKTHMTPVNSAEQNGYIHPMHQGSSKSQTSSLPIGPRWAAPPTQKELVDFRQQCSEPVIPSLHLPLDQSPATPPALPEGPSRLSDNLPDNRSTVRVHGADRGGSKKKNSGRRLKRKRDKGEEGRTLEEDEPRSRNQKVFASSVVSTGVPQTKGLAFILERAEATDPVQQWANCRRGNFEGDMTKTTFCGQNATGREKGQMGAEVAAQGTEAMSESFSLDGKAAWSGSSATASLPSTPSVGVLEKYDSICCYPDAQLPQLQSDYFTPAAFQKLLDSGPTPFSLNPSASEEVPSIDIPMLDMAQLIPSAIIQAGGAAASTDNAETIPNFDSDIMLPSLRTLGLIEPGAQTEQNPTSFMEAIGTLEDPDKSKLSSHACAILERWQAHCRELGLEKPPPHPAAAPSLVTRSDPLYKAGMCGPPPLSSNALSSDDQAKPGRFARDAEGGMQHVLAASKHAQGQIAW